jgi:S-adenosylmethionine:diacylglycerol 3-amino-3-carboxypropyl transferase
MNLKYIAQGIINAGRFEQYISKLRFLVYLFVGRKNLHRLIACQNREEQVQIFENHIASRRSLRLLFKIAFHPAIYKKRGLQEQALIHAGKSTGEKFYSRFRDFCTGNPAAENYFLQYFLTGSCITDKSLPIYLQPENKARLLNNLQGFSVVTTSFQEALREGGPGFYNKIHLSNLGDWQSKEQFAEMLALIKTNCSTGTKICSRYLQKNHFTDSNFHGFNMENELSSKLESKDRFPFYTIQVLTMAEENHK